MPQPADILWQAVQPDGLVISRFAEECVVYNDATGSTHLLAPLAAEVLLVLKAKAAPLSLRAMISAVSSDDPQAEGHDFEEAITAILSEFERLGLAERVTD